MRGRRIRIHRSEVQKELAIYLDVCGKGGGGIIHGEKTGKVEEIKKNVYSKRRRKKVGK